MNSARNVAIQYVGVALFALLVLGWNLGSAALDDHEAYVAVPAANMADPNRWLDEQLATAPVPENSALNHWLVPVFNGQPRLLKTPLAYWCVAGLIKLGLPLNETTARLPSLLAALITVLLTLHLGRRLFTPRIALLAAVFLTTSVGLWLWGRNGRPEMLLAMPMTAAMVCFHHAINAARWRRHIWLLAAWGCLGLANLAKEFVPLFLILPCVLYLGLMDEPADEASAPSRPWRDDPLLRLVLAMLIGMLLCNVVSLVRAARWWRTVRLPADVGLAATAAVLVGGPVAWYFVATRAWRRLTLFLPTLLPGLALLALLFLPWIVYISRLYPDFLEVIHQQTAGRGAAGDVGKNRIIPGFYLFGMFAMSLPWSLLLPAAVAAPFVKKLRADRKGLGFVLLWALCIMVLFGLAGGQSQHYLLPAMAPLALLLGYAADDLFLAHRWLSGRQAGRALWALTLGAGLACCVLAVLCWTPLGRQFPGFKSPGDLTPLLVVAGVLTLAVLLAATWFARGGAIQAVATLLCGVGAAFAAYSVNPSLGVTDLPFEQIARHARRELRPGERLAGWGKINGTLLYYFGQPIPEAEAVRDHYRATCGEQEGDLRWLAWLADANLVFVAENDKKNVESLEKYGFRSQHVPVSGGVSHPPDLYRHRRPPPPPASAPDRGPTSAP